MAERKWMTPHLCTDRYRYAAAAAAADRKRRPAATADAADETIQPSMQDRLVSRVASRWMSRNAIVLIHSHRLYATSKRIADALSFSR